MVTSGVLDFNRQNWFVRVLNPKFGKNDFEKYKTYNIWSDNLHKYREFFIDKHVNGRLAFINPMGREIDPLDLSKNQSVCKWYFIVDEDELFKCVDVREKELIKSGAKYANSELFKILKKEISDYGVINKITTELRDVIDNKFNDLPEYELIQEYPGSPELGSKISGYNLIIKTLTGTDQEFVEHEIDGELIKKYWRRIN